MVRQLETLLVLAVAVSSRGQTGPAIAYEAHTASGIMLMVMNADGSGKTALIMRGRNRMPNWSPDGTQLVFASDLNGAGIYLIDVNGTGLCKVVAINDSNNLYAGPVWSPVRLSDANYWIVYADFSSTTSESYALFAVKASCASPGAHVQLTNSSAASTWFPSWSQDATKIAAQVSPAGGPYIGTYSIAIASGVPQLSSFTSLQSLFGGRYSADPDFAKIDDRIALEANFPTSTDPGGIWITDGSSVGTYDVTNTTAYQEIEPSWSSDDSQIVYRRQPFSNGQFGTPIGLYKRNLTTGTITKLAGTGTKVRDLHYPAWRR